MKKTMSDEELYSEFVQLCGMTDVETKNPTREGIRLHNKAMTKLRKLSTKIAEESANAEVIMSRLMENDDPSVRLEAAANALRLNLCIEKAEEVLEQLTTVGRNISFDAEMTLRVWRGEFPGNHL